MCSKGAVVGLPSQLSAEREPQFAEGTPSVHRMTNTMLLPLAHPGRLAISWTMAARLGESYTVPAVHAEGVHCTAAVVRGRLEMLPMAVVKVVALPAACP